MTVYHIDLDEVDLGQILDDLQVRAQSWERTADYLRTGEMPADEGFIVEECSKAEEAVGIAVCYRSIIRNIRIQLEHGRLKSENG